MSGATTAAQVTRLHTRPAWALAGGWLLLESAPGGRRGHRHRAGPLLPAGRVVATTTPDAAADRR